MECVKVFLSNEYQTRLRMFAQKKSERHEDAINSYKEIFIAHFNIVKKENKHCKNCKYKVLCDEIRNVWNSISNDEIIIFFDKLRSIYLKWIDSEISVAIDQFEDLFKGYDLVEFIRDINEHDIFFKARKTNQVLTKWDMFHIPFNKRYLIGNQRYSLPGQPMVYVGKSIIDIAKELEVENLSELKISMIRFIDKKLKIYDLKNPSFYLLFTKVLADNFKYNKNDFFKSILCSICSFKKRQELNGFSFCEEYVIPQIFALILKKHNFDGISYISTKKYENLTYDDSGSNEFKENIAIFTKNIDNHVYDKNLYDKMIIGVPIDKNFIDNIAIEDLEDVYNEIKLGGNSEKTKLSDLLIASYKRVYSKMKIDDIEYFKSDYGKVHTYELYTVLNGILVGKDVD